MTIFSGTIIAALVVTVVALVIRVARVSHEMKELHKEIGRLEGTYTDPEIPEDKESDSHGY